MTASIREFNRYCWSEVYNRIIGAVVFIDDHSSECLHWDGGLFNLMSGGAVEVKSLSPFEYAKRNHKKAVFITKANSTQLKTIKDIIKHSDLSHCIVISTVSLDVVYLELNEGKDVSDVINAGRSSVEATKQLEGMILGWINKQQSAVEIVHIPIFSISVTNNIFLTPLHAQVFPLFNGSLTVDQQTLDLYSISGEERSQVRRLASSLNSLFESLGLKEDVYYMGPYSSLVAGVLENSPVSLNRRKGCTSPASLILVDGTLDLCGVTSHSLESMLDKLMAVLPRFPRHTTDVAIDMSALCEANASSALDDVQLSPGCIYHDSLSCEETLSDMVHKPQKDVMAALYEKLAKVDVLKSPGSKTLARVTPQSLTKIVMACKGNYDQMSRHSGLLQQAMGVVNALRSPRLAQAELALRLEREARQNLAASGQSTSVLVQMTNLIKSRQERNLPLVRLLSLLVHIYSLAGTEISFSSEHEEQLTEALADAVFQDHVNLMSQGVESERPVSDPYQCKTVALELISRLRDVATMRRNLSQYNSVLLPNSTGTGVEYKGVLQQLLDDILEPSRPLVDLKQRQDDGIKDLLRTGLSMLTSKKARTSKHPLDNPLVILFVIGGATSEQCSRIHQRVDTSGVDATFLVGSTRLVSAVEATRDVLNL